MKITTNRLFKTTFIYGLATLIFLAFVLQKGLTEEASIGFYIGCIMILLYTKSFFSLHFYFMIIGLNMYLLYVPLKFLNSITVTSVVNLYFILCVMIHLFKHRFGMISGMDRNIFRYLIFVFLSLVIYSINAYVHDTGIIAMIWRMSPVYFSVSTIFLLWDHKKYIDIFLMAIILAAVFYITVAYLELAVGKTCFYHLWAGGERYRNGIMRVGSTLGDPNTLAMYAVPTSFLLLTRKVQKLIGQKPAIFIFLYMTIIILLSGSRLSLLAFIFGIGIWFLFNGRPGTRVILLLGLFFCLAFFPYIISEIYNIDTASSGQRVMLTLKAINMWRSDFLLGIGIDNFLRKTYWMTMNEYVRQLVEFGISGFFIYINFYIILATFYFKNQRNFSREKKRDSVCILSALAAFAFNSISMDSYFHYIMWILPPLCLIYCTQTYVKAPAVCLKE